MDLLEPVWPRGRDAGDTGSVGQATALLERRPMATIEVPDQGVVAAVPTRRIPVPRRAASPLRPRPVPTLSPLPSPRAVPTLSPLSLPAGPPRPDEAALPLPAHRTHRTYRTHRTHRTHRASAAGWSRWRILVAYGCGIALMVAAGWVAADVTTQLHRTDATMASVQARVQQTVARVHATQVALHKVSAQSAAAARTLTTETSQLAADESHLSTTEADLTANGVNISDLDACLSGVQQALNEISLGDRSAAEASLDGVAATCRAAEPVP